MKYFRYPLVKSEKDVTWMKYCGFLDLTIQQFMTIQEGLLLQQLEKIPGSTLGMKLMGGKIPRSVEECRHSVPLTTYEDYLPELEQHNEELLPEKPYVWAHTSGGSGTFKQIPYTQEFYNSALDSLMAAFILACSNKKGQSSLIEGDRVLFNVAPLPYLSGILASGASESFNLRPVIPPWMYEDMDFKEKVAKGFEVSLQTGVDVLIAMTSVLVKVGRDFNELTHNNKSNKAKYITHPGALCRIARAFLRSKLERRKILPRDIWPVKAAIGWGIDTRIHGNLVHEYWGVYPYELHACTEAGIIALQSWTKKDLTFIPYSNFFEFIPEAEWRQSRRDCFYEPRTVLLSEVEPGEQYELVITSFHRMPFIRYRLGHLVRITALADKEAQVYLPQMVFEARADELIDIAGFTRISEKTIAQGLANVGFDHEEWTIRKEVNQSRSKLHLYIELNNNHSAEGLASALHDELKHLDSCYHDLDTMLEIHPLEVTALLPGTFKEYYVAAKERGAELHLRKPPRMNASDEVIGYLVHPSVMKRSFPYTNYDEDTGRTSVEMEKSLSGSP